MYDYLRIITYVDCRLLNNIYSMHIRIIIINMYLYVYIYTYVYILSISRISAKRSLLLRMENFAPHPQVVYPDVGSIFGEAELCMKSSEAAELCLDGSKH